MSNVLVGSGPLALRPAANLPNIEYHDTDNDIIWRADGVNWSIVAGSTTARNPMRGPGDLMAGGQEGVPVRVPAATADGLVLTSKAAASGGVDWEAAAGGAPTGAAGGDLAGTYPNPTVPGLLLKQVSLTITDAQIKALLATPLALVTPAPQTAALPVAVWVVCHFDDGIYVDPDQIGNITIQEQGSTGKYVEIMVDNDFFNPGGAAIGAKTFYQFWQGSTSGNPTVARLLQVGPSSPVGGGPLVVQKDLQGLVEFTGGGSGNYIKLVLWYLLGPTS